MLEKHTPKGPFRTTKEESKAKNDAKEKVGKLIATVNSRMHNSELPRASDFNLPYNGGVYVQSESQANKVNGKIQAKEHRNAMQVLPHLLHDIDDDMCHLAAM